MVSEKTDIAKQTMVRVRVRVRVSVSVKVMLKRYG